MTSGIYAYWDNVKGYYTYVGKDSNIGINKRHKDHLAPSNYDKQPLNSVIQNNPERYEYRVIMEGDYNDWQLNQMEKLCIKSFKTFKEDYPERSVFNFTKGGDGSTGYKHTEENRKKMSENHPDFSGENHPQWKDFPRIIKGGFLRGKQQYAIKYNGKMIKRSIDRNKLESLLNEQYDIIISGGEIKEKPQYKIVKDGFDEGRQRYSITYGEKKLKKSVYIEKLEDWFKDNYPNERLIIGG